MYNIIKNNLIMYDISMYKHRRRSSWQRCALTSLCFAILGSIIGLSADVNSDTTNDIDDFFGAYCQAVEKADSNKMQQFYALPSLIAGQSSNEIFSDNEALLASAQRRLGYLQSVGLNRCQAFIVNTQTYSEQFKQVEINWAFYLTGSDDAIQFKTFYTLKLTDAGWRIVFALDPFEQQKLVDFNRVTTQ